MITTRLQHKELLVAVIWRFTFEVPRHFSWEGGQHAIVIVENDNMDDRGNARPLSIITAPFENSLQFVTHIPADASTFKRALRDLEIGDSITLTLPQASFQSELGADPAVFVVGGIGAGSIRSLLMDKDHQGVDLHVRLIYYAADGQHLFKKDFDAIASKHKGCSVEYLVAEDLHEKGGIKEVERRMDAKYYFSGVYTRELLSHDQIPEHVAGPFSDERREVELLARAAGLI
jgi:ferredoxin-NADP reductase